MLKQKALSLISGMALLVGGASVGNAAGLTLDSQFVRGAVLGTSEPFDIATNPNGAQIFELFPGFITGGGPTQNGTVTFAQNQLPLGQGFNFTLNGAGPLLIGNSDGTSATEVFMDDITSTTGDQDLIEFLFTLTTNQGSLTDSDMVILSLVGDFGSDPLGFPSTLGSAATGGAFLTLTEVNVVPLPAGMVLLLSALGGFILVRRRTA